MVVASVARYFIWKCSKPLVAPGTSLAKTSTFTNCKLKKPDVVYVRKMFGRQLSSVSQIAIAKSDYTCRSRTKLVCLDFQTSS